MKLASLKKTPEEKKKEPKVVTGKPAGDNDEYPYFSRMTVSGDDILKAVGLDDVKAGDVLKLEARVRVKEVTKVDQDEKNADDYNHNRVEIQFEEMGVENADEDEAAKGFSESEESD